MASTSQIQTHFLNVKPAILTSSDDCYCFIFMNIAHLYSNTKQQARLITDLCKHNTLFLCFCETYLNPIRSGMFQTANDPMGGGALPTISKIVASIFIILYMCILLGVLDVFQLEFFFKFTILTILQRFQNRK